VGTDAFPLSLVPFQEIVAKVEAGTFRAKPSRVLSFEQIVEAHRIMESGQAAGKLVVTGA
jgi:NADPH:quinone reductase